MTPIVRLKPRARRRVAGGHRWVFSNEIDGFDRSIPPGEDVVVVDHRDRVLGSGTFNPHSLISVRLHAPGEERPLDGAFLRDRVGRAAARRQAWLGPEGARACRVVFGEADDLPGLVVDRYGDHLSVQLLTAAMDRRRDEVLAALGEVLAPRGIVLRNDARARALEGLPLQVEVAGEVPDAVRFRLGELVLWADLRGGQKTGFFFDQRENYRLIRPLCPGARVLDAFCYSGAWGLHAALWGAREVVWLDASAAALEMVRRNARENGLEAPRTVEADALGFLKDAATRGETFDLVVLDPPAFAKSRRHVPEALKGYLNLNKWGLRAVRPGGHLVTCSCSHHVRPEAFVETVARAAAAAGRGVRVVGSGGQGPDHPWLPAMPETSYLKALLLQVD